MNEKDTTVSFERWEELVRAEHKVELITDYLKRNDDTYVNKKFLCIICGVDMEDKK